MEHRRTNKINKTSHLTLSLRFENKNRRIFETCEIFVFYVKPHLFQWLVIMLVIVVFFFVILTLRKILSKNGNVCIVRNKYYLEVDAYYIQFPDKFDFKYVFFALQLTRSRVRNETRHMFEQN